MPRLVPKDRNSLPEFEELFQGLEQFFGFLPNDYLTMAHHPEMLNALSQLTNAIVMSSGETSMDLRLLIALITSRTSGCMYCTAHSAELSRRFKIPTEKIQNIHQYETHPAFTEAERIALNIAEKSGQLPNAVTDEHFDQLQKHYSTNAIAEIVGVVSMMAFYNRWNDTVATTLEEVPAACATHLMGDSGWKVGKHDNGR